MNEYYSGKSKIKIFAKQLIVLTKKIQKYSKNHQTEKFINQNSQILRFKSLEESFKSDQGIGKILEMI